MLPPAKVPSTTTVLKRKRAKAIGQVLVLCALVCLAVFAAWGAGALVLGGDKAPPKLEPASTGAPMENKADPQAKTVTSMESQPLVDDATEEQNHEAQDHATAEHVREPEQEEDDSFNKDVKPLTTADPPADSLSGGGELDLKKSVSTKHLTTGPDATEADDGGRELGDEEETPHKATKKLVASDEAVNGEPAQEESIEDLEDQANTGADSVQEKDEDVAKDATEKESVGVQPVSEEGEEHATDGGDAGEETQVAATQPAESLAEEDAAPQRAEAGVPPLPPVRVGLCANPTADINEFARVLMPRVFTHRPIVWVNLQKNGLLMDNNPDRRPPDVAICLGYFYHASLRDAKASSPSLPPGSGSLNPKPLWEGRLHWPELQGSRALRQHVRGRPYLIAFAFEPWDGGDCTSFDMMFTCCADVQHRNCPLIHLPYSAVSSAMSREEPRQWVVSPDESARREQALADLRLGARPGGLQHDAHLPPRRFALFLVSECYKHVYMPDALVRIAFFDRLHARKPVDSLGGCRQSNLSAIPSHIRTLNPSDRAFQFAQGGVRNSGRGEEAERMRRELFSQYKFVITMENVMRDGWVSERMLATITRNNTIPIYFGAPDVGKYWNKRRFVNLEITQQQLLEVRRIGAPLKKDKHRLNELVDAVGDLLSREMDAVIEQVLLLDSDEIQFQEMVAKPPLPNNSAADNLFDLSITAAAVRRSIQQAKSYVFSNDPSEYRK